MASTLIRLLAFLTVIFLLLEISLRVYYFGGDAFSPEKLNSYQVITDSELVQAADNTEVYYELKPNLDSLHSGKALRTNSRGLADKEYTLEKPANTYRIAVVGSSWSMATGVATQDSYQALIESRLNERFPNKNTEVINFAVEYYGLQEIIGSTRHKALAYQPDMIIMAITSMTPSVKWIDDKEPFNVIDVVPPFWQSLVYSSLMARIGKQAYAKSQRPLVFKQGGGYARNINRSMAEMSALTADKNIDVVVIWLTHTLVNQQMRTHARSKAEAQGFTFIPLHLDTLAGERYSPHEFLVGHVGRHPNETGHQLLTEEIITTLWPPQTTVDQPRVFTP